MSQAGTGQVLRAHKREERLEATERSLDKVKARVDAGKLKGADAIGVRVGTVISQYQVAKLFELRVTDAALFWAHRDDRRIAAARADENDRGVRPFRSSASFISLRTSVIASAERSRVSATKPAQRGSNLPSRPRPVYRRSPPRLVRNRSLRACS